MNEQGECGAAYDIKITLAPSLDPSAAAEDLVRYIEVGDAHCRAFAPHRLPYHTHIVFSYSQVKSTRQTNKALVELSLGELQCALHARARYAFIWTQFLSIILPSKRSLNI
jgi:hypothetical protein